MISMTMYVWIWSVIEANVLSAAGKIDLLVYISRHQSNVCIVFKCMHLILADWLCKNILHGRISPSFGEPLKKYQAEMKQLPGEKKSALDVSRQRLEEDKRSDKGEPSVLPTETTKKQSKKINASAGNSHSYTVKQNLKKLPTDEKGKLLCICRTHYDPSR